MQRVFREYERRKAADELLDFEDLSSHEPSACSRRTNAHERAVPERWRAITVDEYQDVNLLQQTLLDLWLGERDELCVVGDDYQAIYSLHGGERRDGCSRCRSVSRTRRVVRLERSYRSTPQMLALANRLVPRLGGSAKTLARTVPAGPEPIVGRHPRPWTTSSRTCGRCTQRGLRDEEMAVLVRTNARTTEYEEACHDAAIPFQGAAIFLHARDAARQLLKALRGRSGPASAVRCVSWPFGRDFSPRFRTSSARRADAAGRPPAGSYDSRGARGEVDRPTSSPIAARALRRRRRTAVSSC